MTGITDHRERWAATALVLLTFLCHLVFGVYYALRAENLTFHPSLTQVGEDYLKTFPGWGSDTEGDAAAYNRAAVEVLRTGVPRTRSGAFFIHAPLYAYFLAGCYWIGGIRLLSVAVPQALLAALTCWLLILTARRFAPANGWRTGLLAGALFFMNLRIAMYVGYMSPTHLLLFLFSLALYYATSRQKKFSLPGLVAAVIAATYVQAAFFVVACAIALWLADEARRERAFPCLAAAVLIVSSVGGKVLLQFLNAGVATPDHLRESARGILWEANNPYYESMTWRSLWERRPGNPWTKWSASETEEQRYAAYFERAGNSKVKAGYLWVSENPAQYAKLCSIRLRTTLGPFTGMMSPRNRTISAAFWLLIFPAGFCGLWRLRHQPVARMGWLIVGAITAFETLVTSDWYLRYRLPEDLLLMVFAAIAYVGGKVPVRRSGLEPPG